jgi:hypothetical protein
MSRVNVRARGENIRSAGIKKPTTGWILANQIPITTYRHLMQVKTIQMGNRGLAELLNGGSAVRNGLDEMAYAWEVMQYSGVYAGRGSDLKEAMCELWITAMPMFPT